MVILKFYRFVPTYLGHLFPLKNPRSKKYPQNLKQRLNFRTSPQNFHFPLFKLEKIKKSFFSSTENKTQKRASKKHKIWHTPLNGFSLQTIRFFIKISLLSFHIKSKNIFKNITVFSKLCINQQTVLVWKFFLKLNKIQIEIMATKFVIVCALVMMSGYALAFPGYHHHDHDYYVSENVKWLKWIMDYSRSKKGNTSSKKKWIKEHFS